MIIKENDRQVLTELFEKQLDAPVRLLVFTTRQSNLFIPGQSGSECMYCKETVQLVTELGELSDQIKVEVYDIKKDTAVVEEYDIQRAPAIAIVGAKDYGVRYYGIPAGYEFSSLIEDIIDVAKGTTDLSAENLERLALIDEPVHMQVFVTPSCPYCPPAVRIAHKMAIANEWVTGDMVEAQEFPELAQRYHVQGVPRTVVNEDYHFDGAMADDLAILHVLLAAGKITEEEAAQAGLNAR